MFQFFNPSRDQSGKKKKNVPAFHALLFIVPIIILLNIDEKMRDNPVMISYFNLRALPT